ncbi:MAG: hypothetical protein C4522_11085 [Desulfobacteraceae bacterium]|nr:MAG: hypothetical protein C4522_11085 [Desulfobacteraceae bacterium]
MSIFQYIVRKNNGFKLGLLAILMFVVFGCAPKNKEIEGIYTDYPGPQIAVEPYIVKLGISTLLKTPIQIGGLGFDPGDSVFVDIVGGTGNNRVSIPVDSWLVSDTGSFKLLVSKEIKMMELLRLDLDPSDRKPIIVRDTIPPGAYVIKAESVKSGKKAECVIQFEAPGTMDRFKDWLQVKLRKIKKKT